MVLSRIWVAQSGVLLARRKPEMQGVAVVSSEYEPPEANAADHAHTLTRAGLGSIPVLGAAV